MKRLPSAQRSRDERGQVTVMIVGFAMVVLMLIVVVIDATAAYIERQGLDSLADGAALYGADMAAEGDEAYGDGLGDADLRLTEAKARAAVQDYLRKVGAYSDFDLGSPRVEVRGTKVYVTIASRAELPLTFPGVSATTSVRATGSASVRQED